MGWNGLERNRLDFILTDLLPVELSELFSFSLFYDFLLKNEQQKIIEILIEVLKKDKAKSNSVMFQGNWSTKPLKYKILKGANTMRQMSIMQPLSALNLFLFIECLTHLKDDRPQGNSFSCWRKPLPCQSFRKRGSYFTLMPFSLRYFSAPG